MRFGFNGRTENERLKKLMQSNILTDYNVLYLKIIINKERNLEMLKNPV